jgi:hypothetical protein
VVVLNTYTGRAGPFQPIDVANLRHFRSSIRPYASNPGNVRVVSIEVHLRNPSPATARFPVAEIISTVTSIISLVVRTT